MARDEFKPHPARLSSMLFYLGSIIIHGTTKRRSQIIVASNIYQIFSLPITTTPVSIRHLLTWSCRHCMATTKKSKITCGPFKMVRLKRIASAINVYLAFRRGSVSVCLLKYVSALLILSRCFAYHVQSLPQLCGRSTRCYQRTRTIHEAQV